VLSSKLHHVLIVGGGVVGPALEQGGDSTWRRARDARAKDGGPLGLMGGRVARSGRAGS
jgi:hypothetical protein